MYEMMLGIWAMENYNFWSDLLDTYQSSPDVIKALWLVIPPAFIFGLVALSLRHRRLSRVPGGIMNGDLAYTIHRDEAERLYVYRHGGTIEPELDLLVLENEPADRKRQPLKG